MKLQGLVAGGRLKPWHRLPGQEILCIGCLEKRIGRTLTACDFTDCPVNDLNDPHWADRSKRLLNRLTTNEGHFIGGHFGAEFFSPLTTCRPRR